MKITKQTAYRHTVAQRAMRMEEIVAWVKDERTRDKPALISLERAQAYPSSAHPLPGNYLSCSLPELFEKAS